MPKERISHFTTNKIEITRYNSATTIDKPKIQNIIRTIERSVTPVKRSLKASLIFKNEAVYAQPPIAKKSKIILADGGRDLSG